MFDHTSVMSPVVRHRLPPTLVAPLPHVAHAVLAEAVDDVAIDACERVAHHEVRLLQIREAGSLARCSPYEHQSYFR